MLKILTMQLYMKLHLKITTNNQVGRIDDKKNVLVYSTVYDVSYIIFHGMLCLPYYFF